MTYQEWKDSLVEGKNPCRRCRQNGRDRSGDNFHFYGEGQGGFCHACDYTIPSDEWLEENAEGYDPDEEEKDIEIRSMDEDFSREDYLELREICTHEGNDFRGISTETLRRYQVLNEYDVETGEIATRIYPTTIDHSLCGIKCREVPKSFFFKGETGNNLDLFGEAVFKNSTHRWIVICGGEEDAMAACDILEYNKKEEYETIPVVSPINGESGAHKQLQNKYQWLDGFERIYLCFDNDEAGKKAAEKCIAVLPKGKVYIIKMQRKDPNSYIWDNETGKVLKDGKEWMRCFWNAQKYVPEGITSSTNLEDKMREYVSRPRISLPMFMYKMQNMLAGGFPLGIIVNILAASGIGKSTYVDAMILHWIMNVDRTVGIISLEASEGEYGVNLSSSYCGFKINLLESVEERLEYLDRPENVEKRNKLWKKDNGDPRFYLVDADVETMQKKIEYLIRGLGCEIIVLDPIQDVFDSMPDEEQKKWMKWEKDITKREKVTIINISHSRKSGRGEKANSRGADLNEEDMHGHSSIFKSGAVNIILSRDKEHEDEFERNVTYAKLTKARGVGRTGPAGQFYYDNETHTAHDRDWYEQNMMNKSGVSKV